MRFARKSWPCGPIISKTKQKPVLGIAVVITKKQAAVVLKKLLALR